MQNIKIATVKALLEIEDKISEVWKDDDWATAEAVQEVISEYHEDSKLLIRCSPFGSEYMHSTQSFHFDLLGENNILSFTSSNSDPKSRLQFKQFLLSIFFQFCIWIQIQICLESGNSRYCH